jgi:hypothetical protein
MTHDPRIETVAKALARHRLGKLDLKLGQNPELQHTIMEKAVENLWRSLYDEAGAMVAAIDQLAMDSEPPDLAPEPAAPSGIGQSDLLGQVEEPEVPSDDAGRG